ncbi:hypothetical protein OG874_37000 [Nocardia sp. NBC_00565]|nr:hypothetical protein [Nocardia sp. NBC_00565]WUC02274.1 hypothetical protein OG874_37000 [Nocardia sp. NBC_00565]
MPFVCVVDAVVAAGELLSDPHAAVMSRTTAVAAIPAALLLDII